VIIARFYLKNRDMVIDLPLVQGGTLGQLMASVRADGFLIVNDMFYCPYDQIGPVVTYEAEQQAAKVFHIVPPEKLQ